jgi:hypothetical protein
MKVYCQVHASAALHLGKKLRNVLNRRLGGVHSQGERRREEKSHLPLPQIEPHPYRP